MCRRRTLLIFLKVAPRLILEGYRFKQTRIHARAVSLNINTYANSGTICACIDAILSTDTLTSSHNVCIFDIRHVLVEALAIESLSLNSRTERHLKRQKTRHRRWDKYAVQDRKLHVVRFACMYTTELVGLNSSTSKRFALVNEPTQTLRLGCSRRVGWWLPLHEQDPFSNHRYLPTL